MKLLIGMDGGGTKTHCVVTDLSNNKLFECTGGQSAFLMIGTDKVCETLFGLLTNVKNNLKCEFSDIVSIVLGTTGAGRASDAERMEKAFIEYSLSQGVSLPVFKVESDARIALEGAFSGNPGSILIAGTGSIMFGKDPLGNIHRVGGFGRFIGDQGSGYMLGRKALMAISKTFDGRIGESLLPLLLKDKFGIDTPEQLIKEVYTNNFDIASVAPLVIQAAEENDKTAMTIIEEETDELLLHIYAMQKKLQVETLQVSFIGGMLSNENIYSSLFRRKITESFNNVIVKAPEHSPAMGAVFMAKNLI
jgi:N-acetylglucosamine kinase-like BadF-type ATPase